jgi:peroxiredoxin
MFSKETNLSLLLLMLAIGVQAQTTEVQGAIKGLTEPIVRFSYRGTGPEGAVLKLDTVKVKNGKFTWKVTLDQPQRVDVFFAKTNAPLFADKGGKIRITGHADSLPQLNISGSSLQKEAYAYFASLKVLQDQQDVFFKQRKNAGKDELKVLGEKVMRVEDQKKELLSQYVSAYPKSYFSLYLLEDKAGLVSGDYPKIKPLYDLLEPALLQSEAGKRLSKRLIILERSKLGETMLNFTQNSHDGRPVRFSDFRGKYVLVDFWASWCGPCRAENPNVLAAYNRYKDKNFTVLGISLDDKEDKWKKAIEEDKLPWTQVSDLKGFKNEVSAYYGIPAIPTTYLVDPDGKIIAKNLRGEALHKKLAELLDK